MPFKTNNYSFLIAVLTCLLIAKNSYGQSDDTNDLESWNSVNLKYKLNKKWTFDAEVQLRLKDEISEISEYLGELNAQYSVSKAFKLGAGFRYTRENDNVGKVQGYENHFRFHVDATYKHKINDFSIKYRLRYQNKNELGLSTSEGDFANQHIRFKTSFDYNFKNWKLDPIFSAEIFNHFEEGEENGFDKYRLTLGTEYKFKNVGTLGLFYRIEKELNETIPETTNIIGLKYSYTFKNK